MKGLTYSAVLEPAGEGAYSLFFPEMPGCYSTGEDLNDALVNAKESLELHYYGLVNDKEEIPRPTGKLSQEDIEGCIVCPITIYPDLIVEKFNNKKSKNKLRASSMVERNCRE